MCNNKFLSLIRKKYVNVVGELIFILYKLEGTCMQKGRNLFLYYIKIESIVKVESNLELLQVPSNDLSNDHCFEKIILSSSCQ